MIVIIITVTSIIISFDNEKITVSCIPGVIGSR
jgi:hypothetical protein